MLTKVFQSIHTMCERTLGMYREKSTGGLLVLMAAFVGGFIWPLLGLVIAVGTRHLGKYTDVGSIAGIAAIINIATYFVQIVTKIICGLI